MSSQKQKLNDTQKIAIREILKTKLSHGVTDIVFEKADGTIRILKGTRDKDLLPVNPKEQIVKESQTKRKESIDAVPVFDTEGQVWRSFSIEKLISVNTVKVEHLIKLAS